MKRPRLPRGTQGKWLLASSLVLAIGVPSVAVATGEGRPLDGGTRNPTRNATQAYTQETEIIADTSTYGTRQSNKRIGDGGGAIYGCRSDPGREACLKASNLRTGRAFEFATSGKEGGSISVGDTTGPPLTTNAKGVATGFNADQVDGKSASDLANAADLLFASVRADGTLAVGRGATASTKTSAATQTYTVTFNRDVSRCSFTANALGGASDAGLGVEPGSAAATVVVDQSNDAGGGAGRAFHLQVIC